MYKNLKLSPYFIQMSFQAAQTLLFYLILAHLQVPADGLFSFGLGAGQLLPQHLLPHVDGLQRLLDVEEVLLQETHIASKGHR